MKRAEYVALCESMPLRWLHDCIYNAGRLSPSRVLLIRVAIRRKFRSMK